MEIRIISCGSKEYEQMVQLRLTVLLNPIGIPATYINQEKENDDVLVGAFEESEMVGCCILSKVNDNVLQLRQMAVRQFLQGKGIGAAIVQFAEDTAKAKGYKVLMMHARDSVLPFYEKCGYAVDGEQFTEVNIPHHKMQKVL